MTPKQQKPPKTLNAQDLKALRQQWHDEGSDLVSTDPDSTTQAVRAVIRQIWRDGMLDVPLNTDKYLDQLRKATTTK